ncbi:hypothetical protein HFO94_17075 [Rhizobium leguminosarum]|nr:hypothetical protein [Rhizobium leguminosarum]MBY5355221.1 hypothetical protein [Rhizobium leguminosarum]NNH41251.1 hypothetical protein [Rhizobium laguerreae]
MKLAVGALLFCAAFASSSLPAAAAASPPNALNTNALSAATVAPVGETGAGSVDDVIGVELPSGKTITK